MTKDQAVTIAGDRLVALEPWSRRITLATLLVLTAGCAGPESSRLTPGAKVLAADSKHAVDGLSEVGIYIPAFDPSIYGKMLQPDYDRSKTPHLHIGDRLEVVKDEGTDAMVCHGGVEEMSSRTVYVKVETGQLAGEFGEMSRADLRPIGGGQ